MLKKVKENLYGSVFVAAFAIVAILIFCSTLWSIRATNENVDQAVNRLSSFYMEELVGKREVVLRDSLSQNFKQINRVISLLESKKINSQQDLREFLLGAQTLCGAKKLAIVDSNGTVYTAHSTFSDASRYSFLQHDFTEPRIITSNLYGAKKQVVVAVPVENISLQGERIIACFMQIDIDDIAGSLTYEDKNDAGNTYIGLYYKNGENLTSSSFDNIEPGQNLLEYIQTTQLSDACSFKDIEKSFRNGEKGLATINTGDEYKYIYYIPVEGTDWMLTVMVRDNTIADQLEYTSRAMMRRNIVQLVSTAVLIIAVFFIFGSMYKKNSDMRRKQQELELKAQNEEALKLARDEAEKANKAKTDFLFNMSHDIRTPMNAIMGYTDIGLLHYEDSARAADSFKKIKTAGGHLLSLINDILEMSRIESGKLELHEHELDLIQTIDGIGVMSRSLASPKSIDFQMVTRDIRNPYIYADELHLNEIVINLISNAVKYTPEDGKVSYTVSQISDVTDGKAIFRFEVSDNGIGMSEEFQKHLFEAFSREANSTVSKTEGAGLGLSIVKNIVDISGGTIKVLSSPHNGSTFTVELPFRVMDDAAVEKFREENRGVEEIGRDFSLQGKKVLLVEDNEINREIATMILEDSGMFVETAENGQLAVDSLAAKGMDYYDFVLMDIQMPVMNGYEATKAIRKMPDGDSIVIIAISANAFEEDKQMSLSVGMNAHVAKPIDIQCLLETMSGLAK